MLDGLDKLEINQLDRDLRDSQITLQNEPLIDHSDVIIEDLSPNAIPRFFNRLGKVVHTKSDCDKIIVTFSRNI